MLALDRLDVRRGRNRIVHDLNLRLRPGRIFWIVGPNGAGKSSLLRVLAGLDRPARGSVRYDPGDGAPLLYFHSEMTLPPSSTAGDWERLVRTLLTGGAGGERTPVWPEVGARRRVGRLSTGERKRLLLDALLRREGSLLLDEPYEHLSPEAKHALTRLVVVRARTRLVVVATNQLTSLALRDGGLHIEAGEARPLAAEGAGAAPITVQP